MLDPVKAKGAVGVILVVDDDLDIRESLSMLLEDEGYVVLSAIDGADALRLLREAVACPRLIFLDLRMPGVNGWEFRKQQLSDPLLAKIPVVVITADRSEAARNGVVGAAGVLMKPLDMYEVLDAAARYT